MSKSKLCIGCRCKHYELFDDGEDENGNPYPPNPYCGAKDEFLEDMGFAAECVAPDKQEIEE